MKASKRTRRNRIVNFVDPDLLSMLLTKDGPAMKTKEFKGEVKACNDDTLTIDHFISTESVDDGGDCLSADGMKMRGKVVVLVQHGKDPKYGCEPVAECLGIKVGFNKAGKKGLIATTKYFDGSKLNPPDNTGHRLYEKAKSIMPNWSVGWLPVPGAVEQRGGVNYVKEWMLLEYSQVNVGMNSEATTEKVEEAIRLKFMVEEKGSPSSGNHGATGEDGEKKWNGKFHQSIKHAIEKPDEDGEMKCGAGTHEDGNRLLKCSYSGKSGKADLALHDCEEEDCYKVLDSEGKAVGSTRKISKLPEVATKCMKKMLGVKDEDEEEEKGLFKINIKSIADTITGQIWSQAMDTVYYGFRQEISKALWAYYGTVESTDKPAPEVAEEASAELASIIKQYAEKFIQEWRDYIAKERGEVTENTTEEVKAAFEIRIKSMLEKGMKPPSAEKTTAVPATEVPGMQTKEVGSTQPTLPAEKAPGNSRCRISTGEAAGLEGKGTAIRGGK